MARTPAAVSIRIKLVTGEYVLIADLGVKDTERGGTSQPAGSASVTGGTVTSGVLEYVSGGQSVPFDCVVTYAPSAVPPPPPPPPPGETFHLVDHLGNVMVDHLDNNIDWS